MLNLAGPAPEGVTNAIFEYTKTIKSYKICTDLNADISTIGTQQYTVDGREFTLHVIDSVADYVAYMKELFDFPAIKSVLQGLPVLLNSMNGGKYLLYY